MANSPSATREVIKKLMTTIKDAMPSIVQAYDDFPNANQKLVFPSFSIFTQEPKFTPVVPYIVFKGRTIDDSEDPNNGKTEVDYCIGQFEFQFQLDFWCQNKFQRHDILEEFIQSFNLLTPSSGHTLSVENYYNQFAHFDIGKASFAEDDEAGAQRGEWRVKVDISANMRCIKRKLENLIQTIEYVIEATEGAFEDPSEEESEGYLNNTI